MTVTIIRKVRHGAVTSPSAQHELLEPPIAVTSIVTAEELAGPAILAVIHDGCPRRGPCYFRVQCNPTARKIAVRQPEDAGRPRERESRTMQIL